MFTYAALSAGILCASSVLASPITIEFPPTNPLEFVRVSVSGGNDDGDYSRTTSCGGLTGRTGAQNASQFAAHQNDGADRRSWTAAVDPLNPTRVTLTPSSGGSEPGVKFNNDSRGAAPILRAERNPRPGTIDETEVGFVRLTEFTGNALGGAEFGIACGTFSAVVYTSAGMTPDDILGRLSTQLEAQGASVSRQMGSMTLYGLGELSSWTTDLGSACAVEFGSAVPGPGPLALIGLGAGLVLHRRSRRA